MRESPYTWSFGESTYGPFAHIMWSVDGASVRIVHEGNADDIDRELFGFLNIGRGIFIFSRFG